MCRIFYPTSRPDAEPVWESRTSGCGTQANNRRTWALSYRSVRQGFRKEVGASYSVPETCVIKYLVFQRHRVPVYSNNRIPASDPTSICTVIMLPRINSSLDLRNFSPPFN